MKKQILICSVICAIFVTAMGTLGHFFYQWSGNNRYVGFLFPVNESTWEHMKLLFVPMFVLPPLMVYGINGATEFWDGFWQMSIILWIQGVFDRFFIDWYWVGKTKAWEIPGTEDLMPYIPKKVLIRKWVGSLVGFPMIAAMIAGVMMLLQ